MILLLLVSCSVSLVPVLQITDDIETIKSEMEEKGSSMTDGSPLVNIRKNLARVRQELLGMDVRIGVLEHTVMQARLRDRWGKMIMRSYILN